MLARPSGNSMPARQTGGHCCSARRRWRCRAACRAPTGRRRRALQVAATSSGFFFLCLRNPQRARASRTSPSFLALPRWPHTSSVRAGRRVPPGRTDLLAAEQFDGAHRGSTSRTAARASTASITFLAETRARTSATNPGDLEVHVGFEQRLAHGARMPSSTLFRDLLADGDRAVSLTGAHWRANRTSAAGCWRRAMRSRKTAARAAGGRSTTRSNARSIPRCNHPGCFAPIALFLGALAARNGWHQFAQPADRRLRQPRADALAKVRLAGRPAMQLLGRLVRPARRQLPRGLRRSAPDAAGNEQRSRHRRRCWSAG